MSEELICAHCGEPILDDEDIVYPFIGNDNPTHTGCAVDAVLAEADEVYSNGGAPALEKFDKQADIQASLNVDTCLDAEWEGDRG